MEAIMLKYELSHKYKGTGISQGLDRGLLVYNDDLLLVEEGMGLGACAFQAGGFTYFASISDIKKDGTSFEVIYNIDKKLELKVFGIRSELFTRAQEQISTKIYMNREKSQKKLLILGGLLGKVFNVQVCFVKVPTIGAVRIIYELGHNNITIDVNCETEKNGGKLFVMNELGGSIFDKSIVKGELSASPSGWQKMEKSCELYSKIHSLAFTMVERNVPDNVRSTLYWGREEFGNKCCWAGFESEIIFDTNKFNNYRYSIDFREMGK
jgi:hypothetical protein